MKLFGITILFLDFLELPLYLAGAYILIDDIPIKLKVLLAFMIIFDLYIIKLVKRKYKLN